MNYKYFITLIICITLSLNSYAQKNVDTAFFALKIHYLPFEVRTFLPVTINNIEKAGKLKKNITNFKKIAVLRQLINHVDTIHFDYSMVRAKLIFSDNIFYIDEKGNTIDTSGIKYYINPVSFGKKMRKIFRNTEYW
jgi:hypothetical protein